MTTLIVVKQYIKLFYSKYEIYITPILKFMLAFISLILINANLGYRAGINRISIVLIAALMCSFMPRNFIVIMAALFVLLHLYAFSLECTAVVGVVFLLMFLLYFRFSPKDTVAVVLTPVCFLLKIPYVIPLSMGLIGAPTSAISVACGVVSYYMIRYVKDNATILAGMAEEETIARFRIVIDGIINNKEMVVTIVAFAITIILVYIIRRMSVDYAWTIAMVAGALVNVMVILVGDLMFDTNVSVMGAIFGTIISLLLTGALQFFAFHVDYSRAEKVQFEDDEYYYYVKAVPKVTVSRPEKRVKQISRQGRGRSAH
ncbi:MAG: hypothetical protein NC433_12085 [Clostridiales bacterium]|nr:hypothetical protein [Clostridiales bacterium]